MWGRRVTRCTASKRGRSCVRRGLPTATHGSTGQETSAITAIGSLRSPDRSTDEGSAGRPSRTRFFVALVRAPMAHAQQLRRRGPVSDATNATQKADVRQEPEYHGSPPPASSCVFPLPRMEPAIGIEARVSDGQLERLVDRDSGARHTSSMQYGRASNPLSRRPHRSPGRWDRFRTG